MKKIIELSALAFVIMSLAGLATQVGVEHEITSFVKGVFHKFIPWLNLQLDV